MNDLSNETISRLFFEQIKNITMKTAIDIKR